MPMLKAWLILQLSRMRKTLYTRRPAIQKIMLNMDCAPT